MCGAFRGRGEENKQELEIRKDEKTNTLTSVQKDNVVVQGAAKRNQVTKRGIEAQLNIRKDQKSNCVVGSYAEKLNGVVENLTWRKLTPLECERLQTIPDNYTEGVSNTQRYKSLGNSYTVDVICHLLKGLIG